MSRNVEHLTRIYTFIQINANNPPNIPVHDELKYTLLSLIYI